MLRRVYYILCLLIEVETNSRMALSAPGQISYMILFGSRLYTTGLSSVFAASIQRSPFGGLSTVAPSNFGAQTRA